MNWRWDVLGWCRWYCWCLDGGTRSYFFIFKRLSCRLRSAIFLWGREGCRLSLQGKGQNYWFNRREGPARLDRLEFLVFWGWTRWWFGSRQTRGTGKTFCFSLVSRFVGICRYCLWKLYRFFWSRSCKGWSRCGLWVSVQFISIWDRYPIFLLFYLLTLKW